MSDKLYQFKWDVHADGYKWVNASVAPLIEGESGPFLTHGPTLDESGFLVRRYEPLAKQSALFRIFAETQPSESGILAFANRYGLLGGLVTTFVVFTKEESAAHFPAEPLSRWVDQIRTMRFAVELWDTAERKDAEGAERFFSWMKDDLVWRLLSCTL